MTDNSNNNAATDATSHGHLQDKLVKDSIANNQNITAQVKARQNHVSNTTLNRMKRHFSLFHPTRTTIHRTGSH